MAREKLADGRLEASVIPSELRLAVSVPLEDDQDFADREEVYDVSGRFH